MGEERKRNSLRGKILDWMPIHFSGRGEAGWVKPGKLLALLAGGIALGALGLFALPSGSASETFQVPNGVIVEEVADSSLVEYPLFGSLDDGGRLYVAAGTGQDVGGPEIYPHKLGKIIRLEDSDGDGRFDKRVVFADGLVFPQGVMWHQGAVYVASHPAIWRLEDTNGDGVADRREEFVGKFGFTGNGCDIHGPFFGPDGWLYWTEGRHGYKIHTREGEYLEGMASRLWRIRLDGTRMERVAGGGFDNPVEISWTGNGDVIGTMDQWEGDALIHYVLGGAYPNARHPSIGEFPTTGRLLGFVTQFSPAFPAALCGITTLRTDHFGPGSKDSLLTTHFNMKRVQQHLLKQEAATLTSVNKNFLVSTDVDFHPTDVLEDADGSLLVLDMGAWFTYGCPTAGLAPKPESRGRIYRVRRPDAQMKDPWGKSLRLETMSPAELVNLLNDSRLMVRDRAVEQLVKLADRAVADLAGVCRRDGARSSGAALPIDVRRSALWALSRIGTPQARTAVREALGDSQPAIRFAAAHSVGLERDGQALTALSRMVVEEESRIRLKAAEALGRLGRAEAVPILLESVRRGVEDRFLEHALVYALISIGGREATQPFLEDPHPRVRRAALLALDQMRTGPQADPRATVSLQGGAAPPAQVNYETEVFMDGKRVHINSYRHVGDRPLALEQIASMLDTDDSDLREAGVTLINRREKGLAELLAAVPGWLKEGRLTVIRKRALTGIILSFSDNLQVQQLVAQNLADSQTSAETKAAVMRAVARVRSVKLPASWLEGLAGLVNAGDAGLRRDAVYLIRSKRLTGFDEQLAAISRQVDAPLDLRVNAMEAMGPRLRDLSNEAFELLVAQLKNNSDPLLRVTAAKALGTAGLSREQLISLADRIAAGTSLEVPLLIQAFARAKGQDAALGQALVSALLRSPGAEILTTEELELALKSYPAEVHTAARPLYEKRSSIRQQQRTYITQLLTDIGSDKGNIEAGEQIFFSARVGCYNCHSIGEKKMGTVGPDLLNVGRRRWTRGTLEKILFPNNLIVPHYRSYRITTRKGTVFQGLIAHEDSESVYLRSTDLAEVRIARADIGKIEDSGQTVMPAGLEKRMTPKEITDLLEFLVANEG